LEGFRRLNTIKARSDKSSRKPSLSANGFPGLSERGVGRLSGYPDIYERDDGSFAIGLGDDAPGFQTWRFAEAIAAGFAVPA
jgi:hypothetical protein